MPESESLETNAREGRAAAKRTWDEFERVGDRLDDLRMLDYGEEENEQIDEAFQEIEDLVTELDDALYEAQQAFGVVLDDD